MAANKETYNVLFLTAAVLTRCSGVNVVVTRLLDYVEITGTGYCARLDQSRSLSYSERH